jgi:hypothetical protein
MLEKQAADVLRHAEAAVAALATEAAGERSYDSAERLLGIARQLAASAQALAALATKSQGANGAAEHRTPLTSAVAVSDGEESDGPLQFERDGDDLIKRGKSKSGEKGYEHKAPRSVIEGLVETIRTSANKKGEFLTGRIFPLQDAAGRDIPNYQAYLALRWLRQIGLVERVARQRYKMNATIDPVSSIEAAWQALSPR